MGLLVILSLLGAGGIAFGVMGSRKGVPANVSAQMADMMAKYTTAGPRGERVFKPDVANSIMRGLASQVFHYLGTGTDPSRVQVTSDPGGVPPNADMSALNWVKNQNGSMTIMAPVYLAEASPADRFLRAVPPGGENWDGGSLYAVLAYAGSVAKGAVPGAPPLPGTTPPPTIVPTTQQVANQEIPADLQSLYTTLLQSGSDPNEMLFVASELDAAGCHSAAELLRKRAADLQAAGITQPSTPTPGGFTLPGGLHLPSMPGIPGVPGVPGIPGTLRPPAVTPPPVTPGPVPTPASFQPNPVQNAALQMNVALAARGYKRADMPLYAAFQRSVGLGADGFPGAHTMAQLKGALSTIPGVSMAPVRIYPWSSAGGYDGVNAPTQAEWTGQAAPMPSASPGMATPASLPGMLGPPAPVSPYPGTGAWQTNGAYIASYQTALTYLAHAYGTPSWDPGGIDGKCGPGTMAAVTSFQAAHGLTADGKAGADTAAALDTAVANAQKGAAA